MMSLEGIPLKLTKQGKAKSVTISGDNTDSMVRMIAPNINDRNYNLKAASFVTKVFSAALGASVKTVSKIDYRKIFLSFDEVWSSMGEIKRSTDGRTKNGPNGEPKRYHPSLPDYSGMNKAEVAASKEAFGPLWYPIQEIREIFPTVSQVSVYLKLIQILKKLYALQVKSSKAVKRLADSRLESIGISRNATKSAISSKIKQLEANGTYKPIFTEDKLKELAKADITELYEEVLEKTSVKQQILVVDKYVRPLAVADGWEFKKVKDDKGKTAEIIGLPEDSKKRIKTLLRTMISLLSIKAETDKELTKKGVSDTSQPSKPKKQTDEALPSFD